MEGTSLPVRRSRARTQAAANGIRQQILSGAWADGCLLPSERDLARQFGIARNTLRGIVRQLEAEGLVESQPGRGSVVRLSPLGDQMSRAERVPKHVSRADLIEMRVLIEPLAAELATIRATAEDIAAMETALRKAIDAKDASSWEHWEAELRLAIWRGAHNAAMLVWYEANMIDLPPRPATVEERGGHLRELAAVIVALRSRNPDLAGELMRRYVTRLRAPVSRRLPADVPA